MPDLRSALLALVLALVAAPAAARAQETAADEPCAGARAAAADSSRSVESWMTAGEERPPELLNRQQVTREIVRRYPDAMRRMHVDGVATLRVWVDAEGVPSCATVLRITRPEFAEAALAAAPQMRFRPAQLFGRNVATWVVVPIHFALRGAPSPAFGRRRMP